MFQIALLDKYIYVIGGNENGSAEKFDTNHEIWESIAPLPNKTCTIICATSYKGNIYCLGRNNIQLITEY